MKADRRTVSASMWTYLWDLEDVGIPQVFDELEEAGIRGISVATVYHAGRFLQPRSPLRRAYFPEDGVVYFRPDLAHWRESPIKPILSSIAQRGTLDRVAEEARRRSFALNSWTVCLHNTPQGLAHPDLVVQNAWGDRSYYNLCPSQPGAIAYLRAIASDLTAQYDFDRLELESASFMGWEHEFHHEKDGYGLGEWEKFLLSLCFCPACRARADEKGLDTEALRRRVRGLVDASLAREVPLPAIAPLGEGPKAFTDDAELLAYIRLRSQAVKEAVSRMKEAAGSTEVYFLSLLPPRQAWLFGVEFAELRRTVDGLVVCCYDTPPPVVGKDTAASVAAVGGDVPVHVGLRLFYPEARDGEEFAAKGLQAQDAGAQGFVFYNYGLVPKARLGWAYRALAAARGKRG